MAASLTTSASASNTLIMACSPLDDGCPSPIPSRAQTATPGTAAHPGRGQAIASLQPAPRQGRIRAEGCR